MNSHRETPKRKCILIIALLGIFWAGLSLCVPSPFEHFPVAVAPWVQNTYYTFNFLQLSAYIALLIVAVNRGTPSPLLYLPYLAIQAINFLAIASLIFVLLAICVAIPQSLVDEINRAHPEYKMTVQKLRLISGLVDLALAIGAAGLAWLYVLVFRAYKFAHGHSNGGHKEFVHEY